MRVTVADLDGFHRHAWDCALAVQAAVRWVQRDTDAPYDPDALESRASVIINAATLSAPKHEIGLDFLRLISIIGVRGRVDRRLGPLNADSAHRWLVWCGRSLSWANWDSTFRVQDGVQAIDVKVPLTRDARLPVTLTIDDEFLRTLAEAEAEAAEEFEKAATFILQQGGAVETGGPSADTATEAARAEPPTEAGEEEWNQVWNDDAGDLPSDFSPERSVAGSLKQLAEWCNFGSRPESYKPQFVKASNERRIYLVGRPTRSERTVYFRSDGAFQLARLRREGDAK